MYEDAGVAVAKGREGRPAFDKLCQRCRRAARSTSSPHGPVDRPEGAPCRT